MPLVPRETIITKPMVALREFFSLPSRPVTLPEFWKACSTEEKEQYRHEIQMWDGEAHFIAPTSHEVA